MPRSLPRHRRCFVQAASSAPAYAIQSSELPLCDNSSLTHVYLYICLRLILFFYVEEPRIQTPRRKGRDQFAACRLYPYQLSFQRQPYFHGYYCLDGGCQGSLKTLRDEDKRRKQDFSIKFSIYHTALLTGPYDSPLAARLG